jgi:serine phosphatase RsbU (regulator of sigma subunit)/anti-sigma regulatory factor (Ser/Thr protein kinase)
VGTPADAAPGAANGRGRGTDTDTVTDTDTDTDRGEARFRALVRVSDGDVWHATPDGKLSTERTAWRDATRQGPAEVLGDGWLEGVHPDDRAAVTSRWREAVAGGEDYDVRYRVRPVHGDWGPDDVRVLRVRAVPVHGRDGAVAEYLGITADVTEEARREDERLRLAGAAAAAAESTRRLLRLTATLSSAVHAVDIEAAVLEEARRTVGANGRGVALLDPTGSRVVYQLLEGYDTATRAEWTEMSLHSLSPVPHVVRTGEPLLVSSPDELLRLFPTPAMERFVVVSQEQAWVRLPLATSGRPFGVLALGWLEPRTWDEDERGFLLALASVTAQALERALQYEQQRETALLLQRSLLPERLPAPTGLTLAATYLPGTVGASVGGDWYDAFPVASPDGSPDSPERLALVLGDVRGKGGPAAAVMGQVRAALRAYVLLDPRPGVVLERLDLLVQSLGDPEEVATVALGVLDLTTGRLEHASAGHLPGLVRTADGSVSELSGGEGLPLGVQPGARDTAVAQLEPGSVLVWFSDGLVERRGADLDEGLALLRGCVVEALDAGVAADRLPDHLLEVLVAGSPEDDATVLVVRRADDVPDELERSVVCELPEHLTSAATARRTARQTLHDWDLEHLADAVMLTVSELVTNAVVHARTPATLRLSLRGHVLRVGVSDLAPESRPAVRVAEDTAVNGRGLALVDAVADRWGVDAPGDGSGKTVWLELDTG